MSEADAVNPSTKRTDKSAQGQSQSGQLVVEYVLLLTVAAAVAVLVTTALVSRGDEPGIIIQAWQKLLVAIGKDLPDDPTPPKN